MAKVIPEEIKSDLLDQLERSGVFGKYYIDLVDDYLNLWQAKTMLIADIDERGVVAVYNNGGGQSGYKKNDSVDQLLKVNQQMLKLLDSLGIKPSRQGGDKDDGEM